MAPANQPPHQRPPAAARPLPGLGRDNRGPLPVHPGRGAHSDAAAAARGVGQRPPDHVPPVGNPGRDTVNLDEDALIAAADLVGRTGAEAFEIGYLHEDVPAERAAWYAHARYRGARITEGDHKAPIEAAEALARRLLGGGKCTRCGGLVTPSDSGTVIYPSSTLTRGPTWAEQHA